jgi:hypothetical protein
MNESKKVSRRFMWYNIGIIWILVIIAFFIDFDSIGVAIMFALIWYSSSIMEHICHKKMDHVSGK